MIKTLMNSTSWTRPLWAPADRGGGGDGGNDDSDHQDDNDDNNDNDDDDSDNNDGINDDDASDLDALLGSEEDDGDGSDSDDDEDDPEELQKSLATEMAETIKKLSIPEDMIPEDFNPGDPKALRKLLGDVQQHTARNTLAIMFKPIQVSLERMQRDMRKEIDSRINGNASESKTRAMIEDAIPAASQKGAYPVIKGLYDRALKKHGKPNAAIQATKKAMKALGMSLGENSPRGKNNDDRDSFRSGGDALDAFAPLPRNKTRSSARDRATGRLAR